MIATSKIYSICKTVVFGSNGVNGAYLGDLPAMFQPAGAWLLHRHGGSTLFAGSGWMLRGDALHGVSEWMGPCWAVHVMWDVVHVG